MKFMTLFLILGMASAALANSDEMAGAKCLRADGYVAGVQQMQSVTYVSKITVADGQPVSSCYGSILHKALPDVTLVDSGSRLISTSEVPVQKGCEKLCMRGLCKTITYQTPTEVVVAGNGEVPPPNPAFEYRKYEASDTAISEHGWLRLTKVIQVDFTPQCGESHIVQQYYDYSW